MNFYVGEKMNRIFLLFLLSLLYMEGVYHVVAYGFASINPMLMIPAACLLAALETALAGLFKNNIVGKVVAWVIMAINYLVFASQIVYYYIFKKPLLVNAAVNAGAAALTDFWQVALDGVFNSIPYLILLAIPMVIAGVLLHRKVLIIEQFQKMSFVKLLCYGGAGVLLSAIILVAGYRMDTDNYEVYQGMYDPEMVARGFGVLPLFERQMLGDLLPEKELSLEALGELQQSTEMSTEMEVETEEGPSYDTSPNVRNVDMDALLSNGDKDIVKLAQIMQSLTPTNKNQYTGMFEGYNLIYITAEAFSPYAVSEELTPTLYKMLNGGIVVKDYYIPIWATSTSDGEYVNLTGQIPDDQFSMRRSQTNAQPYSLPAYFLSEGVKSYAYHNNSLSYYDRYLTHPNLGYDFKAARTGSLSSSMWGSQVFEIESKNDWPSSDYEMFVATIPEWINEERFHAYYMTVSGHALYNFQGNSMAKRNQEVVANLECSEEMKAYIACNYELEKAMTYLIEELEKAGKLDNTVIVISADHYPYGLSDGVLEEYLGYEVDDLEIQRNCLIMWNSAMETIEVEKTCSAIDLMPTILNLFGFEYDSRLFPGKDMMSDASSLVVFSDRSFITDSVIYNASTKTVTSRTGEEVSEEYIETMKQQVKILFQYSAGILNDDFFRYVNEAEISQ